MTKTNGKQDEAELAATAKGACEQGPRRIIALLAEGHAFSLTFEEGDEHGKPLSVPREQAKLMVACHLLASVADHELSKCEEHWARNDALAGPDDEQVPSEDERSEIRLFLTGVINHEVGLVDLLDHNANMISAGTLAQMCLGPQNATGEPAC